MPIWQEVDIIFSLGRKIYIPKPLKGLADTWNLPVRFFFFLDLLNWPLCHYPGCDTFFNSLPLSVSFQLPYRDCIKINPHNPPELRNKKGGKIKSLPSPTATLNVHQAPTALSPTLKQKCAHTLSYKHTHGNAQVQPQSLVEREGDASKGKRLDSGCNLTTPTPPSLRLPWTKWSHDIRCFHPSRHCSDSQKSERLFFFALSPHNFWIFSATTMGFSLRMRAAAALR